MRGNAAVYPATENGYDSETADSYEVGIKSTLLDDTLLLNLTAFYDPYSNVQIQLQDFVETATGPANLTAVLNAGKQINQGLEFESAWKPIRPLTFSLNVGYLDSYYENFLVPCSVFTLAPGCGPGVGTVNLVDETRPLNAPLWNVSENTTYTWDLSSGTMLARVGFDWRSFTKVAVYGPSVTRSAGVRGAQRRRGVHHHEQGVALFDRRQELDRPVLPRRRLRLRQSTDCAQQRVRRRREPDRLLRAAAHRRGDGDLPLLGMRCTGAGAGA